MRKHFMIFVLCAAFLFSLTACGKQETEETEGAAAAEEKDYVYLPEFMEFGSSYYSTMLFEGNSLYYNLSEYDEEAEYYTDKIYEYSLKDGSQKEVPMQIAETGSISRFARDKDGNSYVVLCDYSKEEILEDGSLKADLFLNKYDSQGNMILEKDITGIVEQYREKDYVYVDYMVVDDQKNLYLGVSNTVLLFSAEGEERGAIEVNTSWISGLKTGKNGKVYISYYDNNSNGEMVLSEIDFQKKNIGNTYKNIPGMNGDGLAVGITKDFLINDGFKVYAYDCATQTCEELLTWTDCNVLGTNIQNIGMIEGGAIMAVFHDWDAGITELIKLTEAKASEITTEKEEIVIAVLYNEYDLQEAVVAFNKESEQYHVTMKTYLSDSYWDSDSYNAAVTRLQNDIISNTNCPDIVNISSVNEQEAYIEKGVFENLYPYLEVSSVLSGEDFYESILDGCTYDGKLVAIPKQFYISTVAGKTSIVGEEMGWTLDDLMTLAGKYPDASCFDGMEKLTALYYCMLYNEELFMDWETGECYFDTDEFKHVLEFCSRFPDTIDWQTYTGYPDVEDLKSDQVLLMQVNIFSIPDLQLSAARFNDDVTFIGYPTVDGSVGCELVSSAKYGIVANSPNKDGAWAFLESYLTMPSNNSGSTWSLPTLKSELEGISYEEGKNWPTGTASVTYADGWSYTYHKPTEEETNLVEELIAAGKTQSTLHGDVMPILYEEANAYFAGQKSLDEVTGIIQNRVRLYMSEQD